VPTTALILFGLAFAAAALFANRRRGRRRRAMRQLLDAADAMEARLRTARLEIEAVVGDDIDDPVRDALREMLRQRLWLREHGNGASLAELNAVRSSIDAARSRIELQLSRIERARAPLG
jgi:Flp pilus assembly protein TadB